MVEECTNQMGEECTSFKYLRLVVIKILEPEVIQQLPKTF